MFTKLFHLNLILCSVFVASEKYLENFSTVKDISPWTEHSDTVQSVGKSKGNLVLLQTEKFQRAVLFTLLNPQPCGAAFAGIKKDVDLDLSSFQKISLKIRGQGSFNGYKFILQQAGRNNYSFCSFFEAPDDFQQVDLPLQNFKPYNEGKLINDASVKLDLSKITSIGIQAYGGAFLPTKQSGVASLEIEWIKKE